MACKNIFSFLRVQASAHPLLPLLLALRNQCEEQLADKVGRKGQFQKKSPKSSSAYIMRPTKVTQGLWTPELPGRQTPLGSGKQSQVAKSSKVQPPLR